MHVRSDDNIRQHLDALTSMRTALLGFDKPSQPRLSSITRIYFVFAFLASEPSLLSLRLDHGQRTASNGVFAHGDSFASVWPASP